MCEKTVRQNRCCGDDKIVELIIAEVLFLRYTISSFCTAITKLLVYSHSRPSARSYTLSWCCWTHRSMVVKGRQMKKTMQELLLLIERESSLRGKTNQ